jgi:hypothetical protein
MSLAIRQMLKLENVTPSLKSQNECRLADLEEKELICRVLLEDRTLRVADIDRLRVKLTRTQREVLKRFIVYKHQIEDISAALYIDDEEVVAQMSSAIDLMSAYLRMLDGSSQRVGNTAFAHSGSCHRCGSNLMGGKGSRYCVNCNWDEVHDASRGPVEKKNINKEKFNVQVVQA